jgi:predicted DNA-binding protein
MARATHNLHVPLPGPVHDRLRAEATRSGRPATTLAREAIESWIAERERHALHREIVDYANEMARTTADLDEDLEKAGIEHLVRRRRKR